MNAQTNSKEDMPQFPTISVPIRHTNISNNAQNNLQTYNSKFSTPPYTLQSFQNNYEQAATFFHQEVNKLYVANIVLNSQLKSAIDQKKQLAEMISMIEKNQKGSYEERKKRHRRNAAQIERNYRCPVQKCGKSYGSEGSLSQHLKIKHPEINIDELKIEHDEK